MANEVQIPIELKYNDSNSLSKLTNDLTKVAQSTDGFNKELLQLTTAANQAERELKDISSQIANNGFATPEQLRRIKTLSANIKEYKDEIREAVNPTKAVSAELDDLGGKSSLAGRALSKLGGALKNGLVAGGAAAVAVLREAGQSALEFESSFAGVIKTTDGLQDEFGELTATGEEMQAAFRNLATTNPIDVNQINAIGELGGQLGVARQDLISFTDTISKLDLTTNLNAEEAAQTLAQFQNVMQLTQDDVTRSGSAVVELGNNFATTERDILGFTERISGAGAIAELSAADVLGISAAFSSVGINAEAGGTAVQKVLLTLNQALLDGGDQLDTFAQAAGLTTDEFRQLAESDPAGAFTAFVNGLGAAGDEAAGILTDLELKDQQLIRAFLSLANSGDLLNEAISASNEAFIENTALTAEAEVRFQTTESQIQLARNAVNDLYIELGTNLTPAMGELAEATGRSAGALSEFISREDVQGYFASFNAGLAGFLGNYGAEVETIIGSNIEAAKSANDLQSAFLGIAETETEFSLLNDTLDKLTSSRGQIITGGVSSLFEGLSTTEELNAGAEETIQELARVSGSYEDFYSNLVELQQQAAERDLDLNPFDVTGANDQDVRAFFNSYNDEIDALIATYGTATEAQEKFFAPNNADAQIQAYDAVAESLGGISNAIASTAEESANIADIASRSIQDTINDEALAFEGAQIKAELYAKSIEESEKALQEAEKARQELIQNQNRTFSTSENLFAPLFEAQEDLIAAQGEYVTVVTDSSAQIANINSQLALDLSADQKAAYEDILSTVDEGSAEWLGAYQGLQADLTDAQRDALIAQRADLEASTGGVAEVYTGDTEAAEDAQGRILAANEAIITSYKETAFEAILAQTGVTESTLAYGVQLGILTEQEAAARLEFVTTTSAIEDLATSTEFLNATTEDQAEATQLLIGGFADSADEALNLAAQIDGGLSEALRTGIGLTEEQLALLDEIGGKTVSTTVDVNFRTNGAGVFDPNTGRVLTPGESGGRDIVEQINAPSAGASGGGGTTVIVENQTIYANETADELQNAVGDLGEL